MARSLRQRKRLAMQGILVLVALIFPVVSASSQATPEGKWAPAGNEMSVPRSRAPATVLSGGDCETPSPPSYCGNVLIVGGRNIGPAGDVYHDSAEIYDSKRGLWIRCGAGQTGPDCPEKLEEGRGYHSATLIEGDNCGDRCGQVLIAGGHGNGFLDLSRSAKLYNPKTGTWSDADIPPALNGVSSGGHTATRLPGGEILFVGRHQEPPSPPAAPGLIYNPRSNQWSETASLNVILRDSHVAVLLGPKNCGSNCGKVLIAGASNDSLDYSANRTAELYDPATGTFAPTAPAPYPMKLSDAVALADGRVLVAGTIISSAPGISSPGEQSQLYDPATGQWTATEAMAEARWGRFLFPLSGGRVLAAGGSFSATGVEVFHPDEVGPAGARGNWRPAGDSLNQPRLLPGIATLGCDAKWGRAFIAGGESPQISNNSESYPRSVRVTGLQPSSGRLAGGTTIVILGTGLGPPDRTVVKVGDRNATIVSASETEVKATVPRGAAPGKAKVTVSVDGAEPECSPELDFDYLPAPQLTGIEPPSGPAVGGTPVTLTGSGFAEGSTVRFGDQAARSVNVNGDGSRITVDAPPNNPGSVPVVVTTPAGDAVETKFKYLPAITGVVPDSGPPEGGTTVTIAGKGFSGAQAVSFEGTEVVPSQVTDTAVTVKSPPHPPGRVRVGVDVPSHGPAIPVTAGADTFTYGAAAVPLGGGSGQTSGGSTSVAPGSQTPTTSGGGPSAAGGSGPPPPGQGQAVPIFSQSPASVFEPGSSAMQSGSSSPVQSPGGVQAPGAAGSQAPGPQPALVSVPEIRPDRAEQYAMVGLSGKAVDPAGFGLAAGLVGLLLCGGHVLGRRETAPRPQARPQEAY